jgi:DNA-binding response OmpR family regulator
MSGYREDTTGKANHLPRGADFLAKPFLPIELARKVRTLLNQGYAAKLATGKTA